MDALFDLKDFDETRPAERIYPMYYCGIHRDSIDWEVHLIDCWHNECPACGQKITGWFDMHTNHAGPASRPAWDQALCSKQWILMNHCISFARTLDGLQEASNCHAVSHRGMHRAGGYFSKGAPLECVAAMWRERHDWLTSHRVADDRIAHPVTEAGMALIRQEAA